MEEKPCAARLNGVIKLNPLSVPDDEVHSATSDVIESDSHRRDSNLCESMPVPCCPQSKLFCTYNSFLQFTTPEFQSPVIAAEFQAFKSSSSNAAFAFFLVLFAIIYLVRGRQCTTSMSMPCV